MNSDPRAGTAQASPKRCRRARERDVMRAGKDAPCESAYKQCAGRAIVGTGHSKPEPKAQAA